MRLVLGLVVVVAFAPGLRGNEVEHVNFDTADQVELHGSFYPGSRGVKAASVILLHEMGGSSQAEQWHGLARALQEEGHSVLSFDFRGHGQSTRIGEQFWLHPINRTLKSFRTICAQSRIKWTEFTNNIYHHASMVNSGECNSSIVVVIGSQEGATLGALWIATEWQRYRLISQGPFTMTRSGDAEGEDITCAVWLSISPKLGTTSVPLANWLRAPGREKVPMYFLYGEDNPTDRQHTGYLTDRVLKADQLRLTGKRGLDTRHAGRELLGKEALNTEELIVKYSDKILEERGMNVWTKTNVETQPFVMVPFERFLR